MNEEWSFKPLEGDENDAYLKKKYAHLDANKTEPHLFTSIKSKTKHPSTSKYKRNIIKKSKRKLIVAHGGKGTRKLAKETENQKVESCNSSIQETKSSFISSPVNEGFNDVDLIKPRFNHKPCSSDEPFMLSSENNHQIPAALNKYLRDYQRDGISFLYNCYMERKGAILGDDMGLGKTIQIIALLSALLFKTGTEKDINRYKPDVVRKRMDPDYGKELTHNVFLIVAPASVLYNWIHEFDVWGYFAVGKYHKNEKSDTLHRVKRQKVEVVLTTFETIRTHLVQLNQINWAAVIVDEVHKIKESKSAITKSLKSLAARCRFGLTGTVLQNSMKELWCLLDWANPSCLASDKNFQASFIKPIEEGLQHNASKRQLAEARKKQHIFNKMLEQWMLRRTKSLIKDQLPVKRDQVVFCSTGEYQMEIYKKIIQSPDVKLIVNQSNMCCCGSLKKQGQCCFKENDKGQSIKSLTFAYMQLLLKVANHLALLFPTNKDDDKQVLSRNVISAIINNPLIDHSLKNCPISTHTDVKYCGKIKVLTDLIKVFKEHNDKVLIFSHSTKVLDIVENYALNLGHEYRRIDGKTKSEHRFQYVNEFNKDPHIFICLVSTRAGGIGLNMTGANIVIIFDPNWNPAHDLQAQDRAYRIGQHRDVEIYRLICAGTIEENMYLRQVYKQQLEKSVIASENATRYFNGSVGGEEKKGEIFGIENIFRFRASDACLTNEILKRHVHVEKKLSGHLMTEYVSVEDKGDSFFKCDSNDSSLDEFSVSDTDYRISSSDESSDGPSERKGKKRKSIDERDRINRKDRVVKQSGQDVLLSVSKVLLSNKILHVHANQDIVGASKAEDHMTKCALQDVFVDNLNSQDLAVHCQPFQKMHKKKVRKKTIKKDDSSKTNIIIGKTPPLVQRKHFKKMAEFDGSTAVELAQKISSMTKHDLRLFLNSFYSTHYEVELKELSELMTSDDDDTSSKDDIPGEFNATRRRAVASSSKEQMSDEEEVDNNKDYDVLKDEEMAFVKLYDDIFDDPEEWMKRKPPPRKKSSTRRLNFLEQDENPQTGDEISLDESTGLPRHVHDLLSETFNL